MKKLLVFLFILLCGLAGCAPGDPMDDFYTKHVYPGTTDTYDIGSAVYRYDEGYFRQIWLNGALLVPGVAIEIDPVFTGSPAGGITALEVAAWNGHPLLTTGTHGVTGTIVGTSDTQALTNKSLTMNNNEPIKWKTFGGVPQDTLNLLASNILQLTNPIGGIQILGGSINLNYNVDEEIYLWGGNFGAGRQLVLYGGHATAISTLMDSPTINMAAFYWDGGASVGWAGNILHDMITAGATPKSQLKFTINNLDILRLENNNGIVKSFSDGVLDMTTHNIINVADPVNPQDAATMNYVDTHTAGAATTIAITDDIATNATMYPVWVTANAGNLPAKVSSTKLTFNPSTGALNGLILTSQATGFTISGGTISKTLTVTGDATISGTPLYTEADTLGTVTGRGATTNTASSFNGGLTILGDTYESYTLTAGENLSAYDACYVKNDGKLYKAKGNAVGTMPAMYIANAAITINTTGVFISRGYVTNGAWAFTSGQPLYVSEITAGAITSTQPSSIGDQVQIAATAVTATKIYWYASNNPVVYELG